MRKIVIILGIILLVLVSSGCNSSNTSQSSSSFEKPKYAEINVDIQNVRSEISDSDKLNPIANVGYDVLIENVGDGGTDWIRVMISIVDNEDKVLDSQTIEVNRHIGAGGYYKEHVVWERSVSDLGFQILGVLKKGQEYRFTIEVDDVNWQGKR